MNHSPFTNKIFIVSGGIGASAEQVVNTVLAQFPEQTITIERNNHIRQTDQIQFIIKQAKEERGFIVHTLVNSKLRHYLVSQAKKYGVPAADLMGNLMDWLSENLQQKPFEEPGRYRKLQREYYDRIDAIDYSIAQDDGKNPSGWPQADIILLGVSRSGKTPLSMYLAVLGWKVANIPLVPQLPTPELIFRLEARREIGLTIDASQLQIYRTQRLARMGIPGKSDYTGLDRINEELEFSRNIFQRGGFKRIDVTNKTIEQCADEVIRYISPFHNDQVLSGRTFEDIPVI